MRETVPFEGLRRNHPASGLDDLRSSSESKRPQAKYVAAKTPHKGELVKINGGVIHLRTLAGCTDNDDNDGGLLHVLFDSVTSRDFLDRSVRLVSQSAFTSFQVLSML